MKITNFIGIDVSKGTLDFAFVADGSVLKAFTITNSKKNLQEFFKNEKIDFSTSLFCLEHTGIYGNILLDFLDQRQAYVWLESAIQIKRSQGLSRGKSDKIDARRIALYAFKNHVNARLWKPQREIVIQLKHLQQTRERLIQSILCLEKPVKEAKGFIKQQYQISMKRACRASLRTLKKDLKNIEQLIMDLITSDENLSRLYHIVTSVEGIGKVTAVQIIITTNEFKDFTEAKKYACYAGVVPFEHSSGTSIKGKTRVSHLANKNIKRLLHMAALVVISKPGELQNYYQRKVQEGKNKMLVINAVRNKLILRVFACVQDNRLFEKNYQYKVA
jgi:transposase